jgi:hypothetical protein
MEVPSSATSYSSTPCWAYRVFSNPMSVFPWHFPYLITQKRVLSLALYALARCPPGKASIEPLVILSYLSLSLCPPLHSSTSKVFNNLEVSPQVSDSSWCALLARLYLNSAEFRSALLALAYRTPSILSCNLLHEAPKNPNLKIKELNRQWLLHVTCKCVQTYIYNISSLHKDIHSWTHKYLNNNMQENILWLY